LEIVFLPLLYFSPPLPPLSTFLKPAEKIFVHWPPDKSWELLVKEFWAELQCSLIFIRCQLQDICSYRCS
jgi:hypothetical protein